MSQTFLYLYGPDDLGDLESQLAAAGFAVGPSGRLTGGIHVRIRDDSQDEAQVMRIAARVAPGARRGPSGSPVQHIEGYREGR